MARSNEDLANAALNYLVRDGTIRSLDDSGPYAVQMKANYRNAMDFVIEEWDWPECRVIGTLQAVSVDSRGWSFAYTVPSDMIALWRLNDGSKGLGETIVDHEMGMSIDPTDDRTYIFTDQASAYIRYGSRRCGIGRFGMQVFDLMALRLAIQTCMTLTKDKSLRQTLQKEYIQNLSKVKTIYANREAESYDTEFQPQFISVRSE